MRRSLFSVASACIRLSVASLTALAIATGLPVSIAAQPAKTAATPTVLRASRILDGTGGVLRNMDIVIENGRITRIQPIAGALPAGGIDLQGLTVLPGLIDTHVHLGWYLNAQNR